MKLRNTSAKKLVTHVKRTNIQSTLPKKMKQSEPTRWNPSLTMFKSIAAVWNEISAIMVERNEVDYLSGITANKLFDVIQFLEPFKDASDELEKDTSPSIQKVVFMLHKFTKHVKYITLMMMQSSPT